MGEMKENMGGEEEGERIHVDSDSMIYQLCDKR